jgi:hypothetical protein
VNGLVINMSKMLRRLIGADIELVTKLRRCRRLYMPMRTD